MTTYPDDTYKFISYLWRGSSDCGRLHKSFRVQNRARLKPIMDLLVQRLLVGGIGWSGGCVENIPIWTNYAVIGAKPVRDNEPAGDCAGEGGRVDRLLGGEKCGKVGECRGRQVLG